MAASWSRTTFDGLTFSHHVFVLMDCLEKPLQSKEGPICKEIDSMDGRLCYELVRGEGPATGWVTMKLRGKATCPRVFIAHRSSSSDSVGFDNNISLFFFCRCM